MRFKIKKVYLTTAIAILLVICATIAINLFLDNADKTKKADDTANITQDTKELLDQSLATEEGDNAAMSDRQDITNQNQEVNETVQTEGLE